MDTSLFSKYANIIRSLELFSINDAQSIPDSLLLARDGILSAYYIPFDWVNPQARVVIVGITPGFTQWQNAMREAQRQLRSGADEDTARREAKRSGAFSGDLRPNLVALLDHFGLQRWLGLQSCGELFGAASHLVQTTSALRHPVFVDGSNYGGTSPRITRHPMLRQMLLDHFVAEARQLSSAVFVPLGPKVSEALAWLAAEGAIDRTMVLDGMPHPSPQNVERINYVLGRKKRADLSVKTNADLLDAASDGLRRTVASLIHQAA